MVPVYIAGSSSEAWRARQWAERLERTGLVHVPDRWFDGAEEWAGRDDEVGLFERKEIAQAHCAAIRRSRVFWLLWSDLKTGADYEHGYAACQRWHAPHALRVVVTGAGAAATVFSAPVDLWHESDEEGYRYIATYARSLLRASGARP